MSRRRYRYPYRADVNLVDQARVDRLGRVVEALGESNGAATLRRLIDEKAKALGIADEPPQAEVKRAG